MGEERTGWVGEYGGWPNRKTKIFVELEEGGEFHLLVGNPDADVTFDGRRVGCVADLIVLLATATGRVRATVFPLVEMYGVALKAEFTTHAA